MKIILSRKGFDSSNGEWPSPILPGDRLRSLPIPDCCSNIKYSEIYKDNEYPTGKIVESLTKCVKCREYEIKGSTHAHLDPDIDRNSLARRADGWRGVFGQCGSSQSHLGNQGVGVGDLFLFFGLFQKAKGDVENLEFINGEPKKHVIWGWLQVGEEPIDIENEPDRTPAWCKYHPHVAHPERHDNPNVIYIAKEKLKIDGITKRLPGYGTFPIFDPRLQLTAEGENTSMWCLPQWFEKKGLTYHSDKFDGRCKKDQSKVLLKSTSPGQEFVIDLGDDASIASEWLNQIFGCAK